MDLLIRLSSVQPPTGSIAHVQDGQPHDDIEVTFEGWLELVRVLYEVVLPAQTQATAVGP